MSTRHLAWDSYMRWEIDVDAKQTRGNAALLRDKLPRAHQPHPLRTATLPKQRRKGRWGHHLHGLAGRVLRRACGVGVLRE
jgi:hypothetical protein